MISLERSNFERRERDFYPTPREAVLPLLAPSALAENNARFGRKRRLEETHGGRV
jgi:hypothetical protein